MFNNNSIPNTSPFYGRTGWQNFSNFQSVNPQEVELMMKQKFSQPYYQNQQTYKNGYENDPYFELQQILSSCSVTVKQKIMNDKNYIVCDEECETLIKQMVEDIIIPQVIATPQGRMAFENFVGTVKKLKDKYYQEEIETTQKIQQLMQDEVVKQRLSELTQTQQQNNLSTE